VNHITIVSICLFVGWLKLQKLNYNARNGQYNNSNEPLSTIIYGEFLDLLKTPSQVEFASMKLGCYIKMYDSSLNIL